MCRFREMLLNSAYSKGVVMGGRGQKVKKAEIQDQGCSSNLVSRPNYVKEGCKECHKGVGRITAVLSHISTKR